MSTNFFSDLNFFLTLMKEEGKKKLPDIFQTGSILSYVWVCFFFFFLFGFYLLGNFPYLIIIMCVILLSPALVIPMFLFLVVHS